ncbi:MAG: hypothetical protein QNK31_03395 [Porticoccus sp.]|nr:hypothetical protein [Porticoccus sp.]
MIHTQQLEKQVHLASLENQAQRHNITRRWGLLTYAMTTTATKPAILGSAVLAGFCLGFRKNQQSTTVDKNCSIMKKILPLAVSYFINNLHNNSHSD